MLLSLVVDALAEVAVVVFVADDVASNEKATLMIRAADVQEFLLRLMKSERTVSFRAEIDSPLNKNKRVLQLKLNLLTLAKELSLFL